MKKIIDWGLFIILCIIWGSSFILMKHGLEELNPFQVAAIRIGSAGLVLLPIALLKIKNYSKKELFLMFLVGLIGNLIPAILFCIAETHLDSAVAGILNALTPLLTLFIGVVFFTLKTTFIKTLGIIIGFVSLVLLLTSKESVLSIDTKHLSYSLLILVATIAYGINVNIVTTYLKKIPALEMVSIAFFFSAIPCIIYLIGSGLFTNPEFGTLNYNQSIYHSVLLGVINTSLASYLFYLLMLRTDAIFASLVCYGIPFVAIAVGIIYANEEIHLKQYICLTFILIGVLLGTYSPKGKNA